MVGIQNMGTIQSALGYHESLPDGAYSCLARDLSSYYLPALFIDKEHDFQHAIGKFKHCVYLYALGKQDFGNYKHIYFYCANERLAKAERLHNEKVLVVFKDEETARCFDKAHETVVQFKNYKGWQERVFNNRFAVLLDDDITHRLWIKVKERT